MSYIPVMDAGMWDICVFFIIIYYTHNNNPLIYTHVTLSKQKDILTINLPQKILNSKFAITISYACKT